MRRLSFRRVSWAAVMVVAGLIPPRSAAQARPPLFLTPPVTQVAVNGRPDTSRTLDGIAQVAVREDETLTFTLSARDPDGSRVSFGMLIGPENATLQPDGRFKWLPSPGSAG